MFARLYKTNCIIRVNGANFGKLIGVFKNEEPCGKTAGYQKFKIFVMTSKVIPAPLSFPRKRESRGKLQQESR
jgi:hypothetical protein